MRHEWERLFAFGRTAVDGMVFEGYLLEGLVMRDVAVAACVFALLFEVDLVEPCRADAVAVCTAHTLAVSQCIVAHRIYRGVRTGES